jgi:hypothetical protein
VSYRLLDAFKSLFEGKLYKHRASTQGDWVAAHLYEDMLALGRSAKLLERVKSGRVVVNAQNKRVGITARRGDGTLGEALPSVPATQEPGFAVLRGAIATIEIGTEVKILAKAMIKQIDRVINDLRNQAAQFRRGGGNPICVAVVGINRAPQYTSVEGDRPWPTDGKKHKHPIQEADEAERRIRELVADSFDELVVLGFQATNAPPYPFAWADAAETLQAYEASLVRLSRAYDSRM